MITSSERAHIAEHAYVPEHLPHYVSAISRTEPYLFEDFVVHVADTLMIFIGYPLRGEHDEARLAATLDQARAQIKPAAVSLIAPTFPAALTDWSLAPRDAYYRLDVTQLGIPQKTRNMLARARRELTVGRGKFGGEHRRLIDDFLRAHRLDDATRFIFQRIAEYVKCDSAVIFEARTARGELAAFDVAEFGARAYAFYMFNLRSRQHAIPGASDLLLAHIVARARAEGKRFVNLGLGIDAGVAFFKRKWGATPFLDYVAGAQKISRAPAWSDLFEQLVR